MDMSKQIKIAKQIIASQTKIASEALAQMKIAVAANRLEAAADAAEKLRAANDAAEAAAKNAGTSLTDEQLAKLGYVTPSPEEAEGVIMLPIPVDICTILVARDKAKKIAEIDAAEIIAESENRQLTEEELKKLGYWHDGNNVWRIIGVPERTINR